MQLQQLVVWANLCDMPCRHRSEPGLLTVPGRVPRLSELPTVVHDGWQLQLARNVSERDMGDRVHLHMPQQLERAHLQRVPDRVGLEPNL